MKELYEYIFKRKSSRKYLKEELSKEEIGDIENFIKNAKHLHEGMDVTYKIVSQTKNLLPIKAPHYLLIYCEEKEGYLENIGFVFQQLDLYLASKEIGSCWLGMAKPSEKADASDNFIIAIGFGKTPYPPYREIEGFRRKTIYEISNGEDERIEAARVAPSAANTQTWFFDAREGKINVFRRKLTPIETFMYSKMSKIDTGIALAHLYIASEHFDMNFEFKKLELKDVPKLKGLNYIGTLI